MERAGRDILKVVTLVWITALAATAHSQSDRFDVQRFFPSTSQTVGFVVLDGGWLLPVGSWEVGLVGNTANDLLVVVDENEDRVISPVSSQTRLDLLAAVALVEWLEIGLDVPIIVGQSGDSLEDAPMFDASGAGGGLGDIRLVPRAQLLAVERTPGRGGVALALGVDLWLPSGTENDFQGEGFRMEPAIDLEWANVQGWRLGLNFGYRIRPSAQLADLEIDDMLTWGIGLEAPLGGIVALDVEVFGELSVLAGSVDVEETPIEGLAALEVTPIDGLRLLAGGGTGLVDGVGAPDWRIFLGVSLAHLTKPLRDRDGDGRSDDDDACPDDGEDFDGFEDTDGCPDMDNDADGTIDPLDDCPLEPEDIDGHVDGDGCPDPDNDWDFIPDIVDPCPNDAEDRDRFQDDDGCPDWDNDEDGVLDAFDDCPDSPESFNDYQDDDGCWDEALVAVEPCRAITIAESVFFDSNSERIQARSYELLDQVARTMLARQEIIRVRIEGHTDSRGSDEHNLELSQRRAEAVQLYLTDFGIAPERLEAVGFGEENPIASNRTDEGRQANRRVDFIIVEEEGCE